MKETVGGIMGSAEEATSDTASKAVEQVLHTHVWVACRSAYNVAINIGGLGI